MNATFLKWILLTALISFCSLATRADQPEIAEVFFRDSQRNASLPSWIKAVNQDGGGLTNDTWLVDAESPKGVGRLWITVDRKIFNEDVALVISAEASDADLIVELLDDE